MGRNIEIKARIETIQPAAAALADDGPVEIIRDDTFFVCEKGRLKLRVLSPDEGRFIF